MSNTKNLKKFRKLKSDQAAHDEVDRIDLSEYDLSAFKSVNFEFENKNATISMRFPESQLNAVKAEAKKRGVPYQRFIREMIQRGMQNLHT